MHWFPNFHSFRDVIYLCLYCDYRYELAKFASTLADVKHGLEERLQQWTEYEGTFDRIISWLNDSESTLKNYTPKNTLQEKTEQQERYQVKLFLCYAS